MKIKENPNNLNKNIILVHFYTCTHHYERGQEPFDVIGFSENAMKKTEMK